MSVLFVKQRSSIFEAPFGGLMGNVCDSSLSRWKGRSRLPIGYYWTFFASSYGWGTMSEHTSKLAFVEGGVSLWGEILHWRVTSAANIYTPLDRGMVLLQLCCWTFSQKKKLRSRRYWIILEFYSQKRQILFWATLWGVRANVRTSSIACWKARSRLPIRDNWTFSLALTVETL